MNDRIHTTSYYFGLAPLVALATDQTGLIVAMAFILVGTIAGLYTRKGSGIDVHPWGHRRSGMAPGAAEHCELSGKDAREHTNVQHGTR